MDFQEFLKKYLCKTCIISVDILGEEKYGNIRVVTGNEAHVKDIEKITGRAYADDVPYEMCFPKDLNFEYYCYRSAVLHQQLHSYVNLYRMGLWLEMYMLPLDSDKENTCYCLYSYDTTPRINAESMTAVSPEISSAVLASCIKMHGTKDFRECMTEVIKDIRGLCDARRCCILLMDEEAKDCSILSDALRPGEVAPTRGESMRKSFYTTAQTWDDTLAGSTCLVIKDEQDMEIVKERNPVWYASLTRASVKSLVLFPLKHNEKLVGYIWASNFDTERSVMIKEVLELTSFFIASEIANHLLVNRLEMLSSIDLLTGSKNRNAMNNRVEEFYRQGVIRPNSLGIVFADLNGLKRINDEKGHGAGDRLLKKSAAILSQVFLDEDIYRAGGDEFMIISLDCTLQELESKVAQLRKVCNDDQEVNFAVGMCFDDQNVDIRNAMRIADERMYEDKEAYYAEHPEKRYR